MSEFQEVARHWKRMCEMYCRCIDCPLHDKTNCIDPIHNNWSMDFAVAENFIMEWAAEHPEPVYPTWGTWLAEKYDFDLREIMYTPIPAEIAQKLCIEPKEG